LQTDKRFVPIVIRSILSIRTSHGSVGHTNQTTVMRCKSGGVVVKKARNHPVVSLPSMSARMMRIQRTLRKDRSKLSNKKA
jgi:hypothetical protein